MKTKMPVWIMILVMAMVVAGCDKDDDEEWGGGNGGNTQIAGALPGVFSVSSAEKVQFSRGNLQYRASDNTWRFAENQWDFVGRFNSQASSTYDGWIDLFGWGTSGYDHGAVCYQPWSTSTNNRDYFVYGQYDCNLNDRTGKADWGYNAISNGGSQTGLWRTMSKPEWEYLINGRTTISGIRFVKAKVNGVNGVILLPDDWNSSFCSLNQPNQYDADFDVNIIALSQWNTMEESGAVFLPAAGERYGYEVDEVGEVGVYYTSTHEDNDGVYGFGFYDDDLDDEAEYRCYGQSVRLVCPDLGGNGNGNGDGNDGVQVTTLVLGDITQTSAVCGAEIVAAQGVSISKIGVCWSAEANPTNSDMYHSVSYNGEPFVCTVDGLEPGTEYHVRAFVMAGLRCYYGEDVSFNTLVGGNDGHAYVDLGLPSGLLWATCNVGAEAPEDYGDYFAWGETTPKDYYDWSTYQYCNGSYNTLTKYCNQSNYGYNGFTDNLTTLEPTDDAATANWGNGWRMPTMEEFEELYNNTTVTWTQQNGVNGRLFTAANGNSLFMPAAGCRYVSSLYGTGDGGRYWSSSRYMDTPDDAWLLHFYSNLYGMSYYNRYGGHSVRAVRSARQN